MRTGLSCTSTSERKRRMQLCTFLEREVKVGIHVHIERPSLNRGIVTSSFICSTTYCSWHRISLLKFNCQTKHTLHSVISPICMHTTVLDKITVIGTSCPDWFSGSNFVLLVPKQDLFFLLLLTKNVNNTHALFCTIERLTNPSSQISPALHSVNGCNKLASFFKGEIDIIRLQITSQLQVAQYLESPTKERGDLVLLSEFNLINLDCLHKTIQSLSSSELDTPPTNFFKAVFPLFSTEVLQIINTSLQTGFFPKSF